MEGGVAMNRLFLILILSIFIPTSICKADVASINKTTVAPIDLGVITIHALKNVPTPEPELADIQYGFSNLQFNSGPTQQIHIDHRSQLKTGKAFSLIKNADAAEGLNPVQLQHFETVLNTINGAGHLNDLRPVLTETNFQALQTKVNKGISQYSVLAMLQAMRPQSVRILDFHVEGDKADIAVAGGSSLGAMQGLIRLVKANNAWLIESEEWHTGDKNKKEPIVSALSNTTSGGNDMHTAFAGFMSRISPDYTIKRNFLTLSKVSNSKHKKSIMFVFLMNGDKRGPKTSETPAGKKHHRMHILWPGSKKAPIEQQVVDNKYPLDVSIANAEDGYAEHEWNLVLPNRKPREVSVSLLWSF